MEVIKETGLISDSIIYTYTLSSKVKCYVIPKQGFKTKQAMAVIKFGSADNSFIDDDTEVILPAGTAHFIEHKLFDKKDKSAFNELSKNNAYVNAFTDYNKTAYYFSCSDNFYENLRILVEMVSEPYFSQTGIENEKSIIKSEINMYKDIPERRVLSNLTKIMYPESPLGCEIAGSEKSVEKITPELLYKCYNAFYTPENISIICCGDIEPERAALVVNDINFNATGAKTNIAKNKTKKANDYILKNIGITEPMFNIGFKYNNFNISPENNYAVKMIFDIIAGEGSKLYERLLNKQILTENLGFSIITSEQGVFSVISGKSQKSAYTANSFIKTAANLCNTGINDKTLKRIKNMYFGRIIKGFNSIDSICMAQAELAVYGFSLYNSEKAVYDMTSEKINLIAKKAFKRENAYLSIVK